jgi:hypothetical protein
MRLHWLRAPGNHQIGQGAGAVIVHAAAYAFFRNQREDEKGAARWSYSPVGCLLKQALLRVDHDGAAADGSYTIEFWRIEDTSYVPEKAPTVCPGARTARLRIGRRRFDWKASENGGVPHFDIDVQSGRYLVDATINPEMDPVPSQCLVVRWVER